MSARIVAVAFAAVSVTVNLASAQDAERWQDKRARAETFNGQQVQGDNLLPPGQSTSTRSYLGVEIHQGGLYEPSIFPTETWLEIACIHDDWQVQYSITEHGSSLFKITSVPHFQDHASDNWEPEGAGSDGVVNRSWSGRRSNMLSWSTCSIW